MKLRTLDAAGRITEAGAYIDVPSTVYFSDPCPVPSLTQSIAKVLCDKTALHAWHEHPCLGGSATDEGEPYNKVKAIGNAAHSILLGRGKSVAVLDYADFKTKGAQQSREEVESRGAVAILKKHHDDALTLVAAVRNQVASIKGCENAFAFGHGEVVLAAEIDGIWLRTMIDWMESPLILDDLKTTGMSVAPHGLGRMMADAGWDIQAATQELILDTLDPEHAGRRKFRFFPVENNAPHALVVAQLSEAVMTMGRKKLAYAMDVWRRCMATGEWPAYPAEIVQPDYPGFKETDWLNREIQYAEHNERKQTERSTMLTSLAGG
jgi:hypothetical protein